MTSTRPGAVVVLACLALVGLVACGSGDAKATDTPTVAATQTPVPAPTSTPTPAPTPTPVLGAELVIDGSFENGVAVPDGWIFQSADGQNLRWVTGESHAGQRSIKFTTANVDPPSPQLEKSPFLILEKGKKYMLSAYMRTDEQATFSFGMSYIKDDGTTPTGSQVKPFNDFVSTEWTQITVLVDPSTFPIYENPSIASIVLRTHNQAGVAPADAKEFTLYVDEVSLREIIE